MNTKKQKNGARRSWLRPVLLVGSMGVAVGLFWRLGTVMRGEPVTTASAEAEDRGEPADRILRDMLGAYRQASSYQDQATIRLRYRLGDQWREETMGLSVAMERPRRVRVDLTRGPSQVTLACDAARVRCRIRDPETNDFDHQFVEREAPAELSLSTLYAVTEYLDPSRPQELMSALMGLPIRIELTPLGLLLSSQPLQQLIDAASSLTRLDNRALNGRDCQRVRLVAPAGALVFWIDPATRQLRRVEYPTEEVFPAKPTDGGVQEASLTASFDQVRTRPVPEGQFQLERPVDAKVLRHFVLPPTARPSPMLGQHVEGFTFVGLDDQPVSSEDLSQKLAVLLWFQDHPASRAALDLLRPVYEKYRDDGRVVFRAICTEPTTSVSHHQVEQLARAWAVTVPVLRDLKACGRDLFQINKAPTLVIVAKGGIVQLVQEGADSELSQQLPAVLDRLLDGQDIASEFLRFARQQRSDYRRYLAAASVDAPETEIQLPETKLAPRSDPQRLRLTPVWTCRQLTAPGNVLAIVDEQKPPTVYVADGWRQVVQLGTDGSVAGRHPLPIPEDGAVSFLRTNVDRRGQRYFVGTAQLARQLYVFDASWQLLLSYPDAKQQHDGIQDVQLVDLEADGTLELYVALAGILGVQRVDLGGKRQWSNRSVSSVLSVATAANPSEPSGLLVTSASGQIVPLDAAGRAGRPIAVAGRAIHQLVASPQAGGDRPTRFCGISYAPSGDRVAIGLDRRLREVWSSRLPAGVFRSQIQFVTAGRVLDGPGYQWLMAGPDGSIHVVADDGRFRDQFCVGQEVTGLAAVDQGPDKVLIIATRQAVSAWTVQLRGG